MNWYVIRLAHSTGRLSLDPTKIDDPNQPGRIEFDIQYVLNRLEHPALVPFEEKLFQHPRTKRLVPKKLPFFPNYVFAAFLDYDDFRKTRELVNTQAEKRGKRPPVASVVGFGGKPATLTAPDVEFLQTLSSERIREVKLLNLHKGIKPGGAMQILDGPFAGQIGRLDSFTRKKIKAMLTIFGQQHLIELPVTTAVVAA